MVRQRAVGKPLQYILGNQPFGQLDILCREGVLIPRSDTENWVHQTAQLISHAVTTTTSSSSSSSPTNFRSLHLIDLCTGTGCIPLLLHSLIAPILQKSNYPLSIDAIDIDTRALRLAKDNLEHNISHKLLSPQARNVITFRRGNVIDLSYASSWLDPTAGSSGGGGGNAAAGNQDDDKLIILTSNPPYISPKAYTDGTTTRSVRLYEPKNALVPPLSPSEDISHDTSICQQQQQQQQHHHHHHHHHHQQADLFYEPLINLSLHLNARLTVLECGDPAQATRVACLAARKSRHLTMTAQHSQQQQQQQHSGKENAMRIEIWRCDGEGLPIEYEYGHGYGGVDEDGDGDENVRKDDRYQSLDERWCTIAMDDTNDCEKGARVVVLRKWPFT
ncbi:hypothetical protein KEM54_003672 [Ascosphaera aggregata]|nr:hypothetical protein KEM54_003672 [Ascosphaera aggregata]